MSLRKVKNKFSKAGSSSGSNYSESVSSSASIFSNSASISTSRTDYGPPPMPAMPPISELRIAAPPQKYHKIQKQAPNASLVTNEQIRELRGLIRYRYALDVRIWSIGRQAKWYQRDTVEADMRRADAALETIKRTLDAWNRREYFETTAAYEKLREVRDRILEAEMRDWLADPPWSREEGGGYRPSSILSIDKPYRSYEGHTESDSTEKGGSSHDSQPHDSVWPLRPVRSSERTRSTMATNAAGLETAPSSEDPYTLKNSIATLKELLRKGRGGTKATSKPDKKTIKSENQGRGPQGDIDIPRLANSSGRSNATSADEPSTTVYPHTEYETMLSPNQRYPPRTIDVVPLVRKIEQDMQQAAMPEWSWLKPLISEGLMDESSSKGQHETSDLSKRSNRTCDVPEEEDETFSCQENLIYAPYPTREELSEYVRSEMGWSRSQSLPDTKLSARGPPSVDSEGYVSCDSLPLSKGVRRMRGRMSSISRHVEGVSRSASSVPPSATDTSKPVGGVSWLSLRRLRRSTSLGTELWDSATQRDAEGSELIETREPCHDGSRNSLSHQSLLAPNEMSPPRTSPDSLGDTASNTDSEHIGSAGEEPFMQIPARKSSRRPTFVFSREARLIAKSRLNNKPGSPDGADEGDVSQADSYESFHMPEINRRLAASSVVDKEHALGDTIVGDQTVAAVKGETLTHPKEVVDQKTIETNHIPSANPQPTTSTTLSDHPSGLMTIVDSSDVAPRNNADHQQLDLVEFVTASFGSNAAFRTLLSKLSQSKSQEDVVKRLQRALKQYCADVEREDEFSDVQKAITILKIRKHRENIARRLVSCHYSPTLSPRGVGSAKSQEEESDADHDVDDEVQSDEGEGSEDIEIETDALAKLMFDIEVLARQPFQTLLAGLKELLLPSDLLDEILSIPRKRIRFETTKDHTILGSIQGLLEDVTALDWDWWPLGSRLRPVRDDESRVHWRCVSP